MIRKAISHLTGLPFCDIQLSRTDKGKPFLVNSVTDGNQFDFNVSHDGDYTVLAAETAYQVGIDMMRLDRKCELETCAQNVVS